MAHGSVTGKAKARTCSSICFLQASFSCYDCRIQGAELRCILPTQQLGRKMAHEKIGEKRGVGR